MSCNLISLKTSEALNFENEKVKELLHEVTDIILQTPESTLVVLNLIFIPNKNLLNCYKNKGQLHAVLYVFLNELFNDFNTSRSRNN